MFKPNFTITPDMVNMISEIAQIKAVVERSRVLPLNEAQLKRQAIVRMAHTSTSIEGNKLAEYQVDRVLSGMAVVADDKSIKEVKNYQSAISQMEEMASHTKIITLQGILELHLTLMKGLLPEEKSGHFRPGSIYIVDDLGDGRENVRFEGPPAEKVAHLLNELLKWLVSDDGKNLHPLLRAGIFHLYFVTIHPFADGNGRITRLLTALLLYKDQWDFRKIIVLEDFYNRDRQSYYNSLNTVQGKHFSQNMDMTSWLEYFLTGFLVEAQKVAESIASIGFAKTTEEDEAVFLNSDEIKMMDFLSTTGRITSDDVVEILGVAKRTSQLKLKGLIDKKLILAHGRGPSTYYILSS
jgi:Fic family protein